MPTGRRIKIMDSCTKMFKWGLKTNIQDIKSHKVGKSFSSQKLMLVWVCGCRHEDKKKRESQTSFNIQKSYRCKCKTHYGLICKKPTTNRWISKWERCSTAADGGGCWCKGWEMRKKDGGMEKQEEKGGWGCDGSKLTKSQAVPTRIGLFFYSHHLNLVRKNLESSWQEMPKWPKMKKH